MTERDAIGEAVPALPVVPSPTPAGAPLPAPAPAAPTPVADGDKVMSLVDHLAELRSRVVRSVLAILAGTIVGFALSADVITLLRSALPADSPPLATFGPGEAFAIRLRIAVIIGIALAMPVLLYQLWAFIAPGLTAAERRAVRPWIPLSLAFFALGVAIAWIVLPFAVQFLMSFTTTDLQNIPAAQPYFGFVSTMFLAFGLLLQFPILLYGLAGVGIVTSQGLAASRRIAVLAIAIFSAVATPGGDLVSPGILGLTMYVLFEGTLLVIRRSGR